VFLLHKLLVVLAFADALEYISIITIVHYNAIGKVRRKVNYLPERTRILVKECFLVCSYKWIFDRG
jgi:hypothetical protein